MYSHTLCGILPIRSVRWLAMVGLVQLVEVPLAIRSCGRYQRSRRRGVTVWMGTQVLSGVSESSRTTPHKIHNVLCSFGIMVGTGELPGTAGKGARFNSLVWMFRNRPGRPDGLGADAWCALYAWCAGGWCAVYAWCARGRLSAGARGGLGRLGDAGAVMSESARTIPHNMHNVLHFWNVIESIATFTPLVGNESFGRPHSIKVVIPSKLEAHHIKLYVSLCWTSGADQTSRLI